LVLSFLGFGNQASWDGMSFHRAFEQGFQAVAKSTGGWPGSWGDAVAGLAAANQQPFFGMQGYSGFAFDLHDPPLMCRFADCDKLPSLGAQ
jgi:hypothetical protein